MFSKERHVLNPSAIKPIDDMLTAELPDSALQNKKHEKIITAVKEAYGLDESEFERTAMPLIRKVIKYCQKLPEPSAYYSHPGGLIDLALNRTEAALNLMRNVLVIEKDEKPSEEQKLWLYALFSASMLRGLGKLYTDYVVDIYDKHGYYIQHWQPLMESIVTVGKHYTYEFQQGDDIPLRNSITPLIARRIIPKAGFERIMSNSEVFASWLAILREDRDSVIGPLAAILDRAHAIAVQRDVHEYLLKHGHSDGQGGAKLGRFIDTNIDTGFDREKLIGAEFIVWLQESLENGKIILNQDPASMEVREASVVLHPMVLDIYMQEHKKLKNRVAMMKAFLDWNMHLLTDTAAKSLSQKGEKGLSAIEVNTAVLPESVLISNAKTGKINKVSTLDLVNNLSKYSKNNQAVITTNLEVLSESGKWVQGDENAAKLQYQATNKR